MKDTWQLLPNHSMQHKVPIDSSICYKDEYAKKISFTPFSAHLFSLFIHFLIYFSNEFHDFHFFSCFISLIVFIFNSFILSKISFMISFVFLIFLFYVFSHILSFINFDFDMHAYDINIFYVHMTSTYFILLRDFEF